ncbi:MAG: prepilin-type N-terminal cleavage/methylation domain-containing protein [Deltaproteobacteria bacterium]|jgi:prepilin-type N-terminal cleavage/methylation domain-containing protein|nr:prepilin-type N-terminal cleavage/methylation domain-containing protein [Deltaproteobacteria bacterium]
MKRGHALVELMIGVALIGIIASLAGGAGRAARLDAAVPLQRERAGLLLEYQAECAATGVVPDPDTVKRLSEHLRDTHMTESVAATTVTFHVQWTAPRGQTLSRSLTVFRRGPR